MYVVDNRTKINGRISTDTIDLQEEYIPHQLKLTDSIHHLIQLKCNVTDDVQFTVCGTVVDSDSDRRWGHTVSLSLGDLFGRYIIEDVAR